MSRDNIVIRDITPADNKEIAQVIRDVLVELGAPKVGTAYEDKTLDCMAETYSKPKAAYFVVSSNKKVIGGAGIAQLDNCDENVCELQKMYFLPEARGLGLGEKMINTCLDKARELGFEQCYLETLPYMKAATKLYTKVGFKSLKEPLGNTGHFSCNVWMIKRL
ncbi:GNAT family N-acetyltransferase [Corallibacter vietnamensis]|uniref:GNAT family N-acetyltransferase n=1 Tax=Corallibacter vietnamensis TaxID=904130 RepID=A0ABP7HLC8_9FLAO